MPVKTDPLVARMLDSYAAIGGINHIDGVNLPSKQVIAEITRLLLRLLFPGFFNNDLVCGQTVEEVTRNKIELVCRDLSLEIAKSLEFDPPGPVHAGRSAEETTCAFLQRLPALREMLSTDVAAAFNGDPAAGSMEEIILAYPGLEAISVQRMAHELHGLGVRLIPRMMTEWAHSRTGIDIHPGADIGSHFFIDHGTGVVVGETCVIGNHVKIYHGVTLGARSTSGGQDLRGTKRHPTIEDRVTIYPGATILGGQTVIGAGSTIGGNVFLMNSVPPESLVYYEEHSVVVTTKQRGGDSLVYVI
ncbi:MAG: serine O-acetyltransferase [Candidatus Methylacidiphilales bacterium]|nr:serine O-acetyltransferase [Candidatus Methylacidiphilales bacterium]